MDLTCYSARCQRHATNHKRSRKDFSAQTFRLHYRRPSHCRSVRSIVNYSGIGQLMSPATATLCGFQTQCTCRIDTHTLNNAQRTDVSCHFRFGRIETGVNSASRTRVHKSHRQSVSPSPIIVSRSYQKTPYCAMPLFNCGRNESSNRVETQMLSNDDEEMRRMSSEVIKRSMEAKARAK